MAEAKLENLSPEDVRITIPHVRQIHHWDCGIACAQMILKMCSKDLSDFDSFCKSLKFGDSVWTIDLAQIMNHYNVKNHLTTITLGVDKGYSKKSFYKDRFSADEIRVSDLFENAASQGLTVAKRSVPMIELLQHMSKQNPIIALVDWSFLSCKWCDHVASCVSISCVGKCMQMYQGHFVVVCGYNKKDKLVYYKNPSYREELCCCSMKSFDAARKSYGTDEDLLFINLNEDKEVVTNEVEQSSTL